MLYGKKLHDADGFNAGESHDGFAHAAHRGEEQTVSIENGTVPCIQTCYELAKLDQNAQ